MYLIKYPINEFQNFLNNNQILNIITIETLNKINIIQQNNFELISIYEKLNRRKNKNNKPRIKIDINDGVDGANSDNKLNEISERLTVTEISDNEGIEMPRIRNKKK